MRSTPIAAALVLASCFAFACRVGYEKIDVRGEPGEAGAGGSDVGGAGATDTGGTSGVANGGDGASSGSSTTGGSTSGGASSDGGTPSNGGNAGTPSNGGTSASGGSTGNGGTSASGGSTGNGGTSASGGSTGSGGTSASGGSTGSGGSGGSSGCSPTNGGDEVCDGLDNDCSNGADDGVTCPSGCTGIAFEGNGYQFCQGLPDWPTARTNCETQGLHLVKVDSEAENTFIGTTMFGMGTQFIWLGGDDLTTADSWHWHDGSLFWTGSSSGSAPSGVYTNWYTGYPSLGGQTHCLEMRDDYGWNDKQCTQGKRYVCELLY